MWDAVKQGWLSDVRGKRVITSTSLDNVKTTAGDFNQKQLETTVNTPERNLLVVKTYLEHGGNRKFIGFSVDIQHAKDLAQTFCDYGVPAKAVWGVDPERAQKLADHAAGEFLGLFNAQMLTEGYDDWSIQCIIMAKPTKSPSAYTQMAGRGTRLQEGIDNLLEAKKAGYALSKEDCLILDFVDVTKRHKLVTTASLIGLNPELDLKGKSVVAVKEQIELLQHQFPEADLGRLRDLDQIAGEVIDVDLWRVEYAEEVTKESRLQWHKIEDDKYFLYITQNDFASVWCDVLDKWHTIVKVGTNNFDEKFHSRREAFGFAERMVNLCNPDRSRYLQRNAAWGSKPANQFQKEYLGRLGVPLKAGLTWGEANNLINRYRAARAARQPAAPTGAPHEL
jgi:hypothetical protein